MIYVSLPVHEKYDVVASQLKNFARYLPEAMIVIHLSSRAHFDIKQLGGFLKLNRLNNYIINPTQESIKWGSVIKAHFANIEFILTLGDATKIIFHASNDMLVRDGLADFLEDKTYLFHHREIYPNSQWWPGNAALNDLPFTDWLAVNGGGAVIASQIEGSMYGIDFLAEFYEQLKIRPAVLNSKSDYPREEIFFSSFAKALGIRADGLPYVFSEVHRFDKLFWQYNSLHPIFFKENTVLAKRLKNKANDVLFDLNFYKISMADIQAIRTQDADYLKKSQYISDGANIWQVHNIDNLYGVKRVPRKMTNKIRQYLSGE